MDKPQDLELKYNGRVLVVTLVINTEQDAEKMMKNIFRIARGPRLDAVLVQIEGYSGENGKDIWDQVQKEAVEIIANPNSKTI